MSDASRRIRGAVSVLCLLVASMALSSRILAMRSPAGARAAGDRASDGLLVVLSGRPAFALGFRNVLADVVWLEAVQVAGNKAMKRADYDRLARLLGAVANYDGKFAIPYLLGGVILGESPRHGRAAVSLLERGRAQYPADWRFPFYIGFTDYFALGDAEAGGRAMAAAATLPGCPGYLALLASRMFAEAREPGRALAFLAEMERTETDGMRREVLQRRIRDVVVERDLQAIERAVNAFRARTGRAPADLAELLRAGDLGAVPSEPNGGRYVLAPDGTVRSDRVAQRLGVFKKQ